MSKTKNITRRIFALLAALCISLTGLHGPEVTAASRESKTAIGLAEFGMQAYRDQWYYVYGCYGQMGESGHRLSDCSGLVYAYLTWDEEQNGPVANGYTPRGATSQYFSCSERGSIDTMPRTHGLLVFYYNGWDCSHVGIYLGDGYAVDNSYYGTNMIHGAVADNSSWTAWGKLDCIEYPENGWYEFEGKPYFYIDGEYVVDAVVTIDGCEYSFDSNGKASPAPENFTEAQGTVENFTYSAPGKNYKTAVTADIEIMREADSGSSVVCKVADGTKLTVKDSRDEDWYKVSLPGEIVGYVETSTLENRVTEIGTATADISLWDNCSEDASALGTVYCGENIVITGTELDGWYGAELHNGSRGYVRREYVDVTLPAVGSGILNIRSSPEDSSEILRTVAALTELTLLHITDEWARIRLDDGTTGFVPAELIEIK